MSVAVLDRASFPRVKLCAGWLSTPVWDALERSPDSYPGGLWPWNHCHVHFGGHDHRISAKGYFIRRFEFDDWLLSTSNATVIEHSAKSFERHGDEWIVDGKFRSRYLIGAGGTHCPVARALFPKKARRPVGAQELEFEAVPEEIAATRLGCDGEPELLLHDDLSGYAWNIPKSDWLNVGCGTINPKKVRSAWNDAREFFQEQRHLPQSANEKLDHAKGHSYYLFDPTNLAGCQRNNAFSIGDSLGLAQPLTAEGILPAIISGRKCAEAIIAGAPASYRSRLSRHPVIRDYDLLYRLRERGSSTRDRSRASGRRIPSIPAPAFVGRLGRSAVASGFAWMFSGRPLPARVIHPLLRRL